mmetsp:Transcript_22569/g.33495  ORF Transcript_22569/g.33495 Transcript_22569/m.33495 type:complete len:127 (+) Transcript_22569:66-446(+)
MKGITVLLRCYLLASFLGYLAVVDSFGPAAGASKIHSRSSASVFSSVADSDQVATTPSTTASNTNGKLTGCVCVVTGASRGIGKESAESTAIRPFNCCIKRSQNHPSLSNQRELPWSWEKKVLQST